MKTNEEILNALFDDFVDTLRKKLTDGTATAADLNVIRTFLKDNGIEFIGEGNVESEERERLANVLPFRAKKAEAL
jgi:hypothetical protein